VIGVVSNAILQRHSRIKLHRKFPVKTLGLCPNPWDLSLLFSKKKKAAMKAAILYISFL
jgi:hypothetical protein